MNQTLIFLFRDHLVVLIENRATCAVLGEEASVPALEVSRALLGADLQVLNDLRPEVARQLTVATAEVWSGSGGPMLLIDAVNEALLRNPHLKLQGEES